MLSSPSAHEPISITVNDADGQALKLPGEDDTGVFSFDGVNGASPISSHAPSSSPMSANWAPGAFREAPGSPNSPFSDPPSPFSGYEHYSGPSSPYNEQSPGSSHQSSPIVTRMGAMDLTEETSFDFSTMSPNEYGFSSPTSSTTDMSRGRSSSRSTESQGQRRDISQLGIPDMQYASDFMSDGGLMPEGSSSELFGQTDPLNDPVFSSWGTEAPQPSSWGTDDVQSSWGTEAAQPSLTVDTAATNFAAQDNSATQSRHRRGLSASSNDPFISGYSPTSHTSSPSGEGALGYPGEGMPGYAGEGMPGYAGPPSPVPSEPHLSAALSSRRSSYSESHNGHSVAAANRGRSHSRTSSSASSSRRPSPYSRPDSVSSSQFLAVPDHHTLQRRHSLHNGRVRPMDDRPLSDAHATLQRHISAPVPRSREPSPARPGHRPCGRPSSPYLLPQTVSPNELHNRDASPARFGHRPSVSEDIRASGSSTLAPPTTVSPQDLFLREPSPARFGHRGSMSEDRRYAGASSLAPPGQEAPYQEPSPFRVGPSSSFRGGQEALYSNEGSSSSSFLSPTTPEDLQLGESDIVKKKVASAAILQASGGRRKKAADFKCTWEQCNATFTAKHNLTNHMNSHKGVKPHKCRYCGNGFTTSGTARRHENQCSQNPGKQAGGAVSSS
ncbi:uncharacterized protein SCHCODRAFT_02518496 [Schizophyllum commune H4-8]|uniref:uncharacterized protein n=1 Tax=Schizophyllum commune (strain H4-8 / FGSC 9210) TaxID=578458 RepID=UPI00215DEDA3|nr:uncharacterized protein SCHCODRAFT_02518496 [Schizophyllum commune H4-8]KAI5885874.1 hypothetical protein SCHCODRAFT_02518496 [Schizophyllum commune H4-8]